MCAGRVQVKHEVSAHTHDVARELYCSFLLFVYRIYHVDLKHSITTGM